MTSFTTAKQTWWGISIESLWDGHSETTRVATRRSTHPDAFDREMLQTSTYLV